MRLYDIQFDGHLLERGFWLYVWRITYKRRQVLYVGRTGDSSSRYAASPFSRLSHHLDIRQSSKSNTLLRNIEKIGFDPVACKYELLCVGPLYPEQEDLKKHRQYRDIVAPLEAALAAHLRQSGHEVIGVHPHEGSVDKDLLRKVRSKLKARL